MNRLVVTFVILFVWGCSSPQTHLPIPTYSDVLLGDLTTNARLDSLLHLPMMVGVDVNQDWQVIATDTVGGLNPTIPSFDSSESVTLPHRILLPNSPIWYRTSVPLDNGVLHIRADDGAQLWLNGQRVHRLTGEYFPIHATSNQPTEITIRVLNNAMEGGLRSVQWIAQKDWSDYQSTQQKHYDQWITERKLSLIHPDLKQADLSAYPAMLTDPYWQSANDSLYLRWQSEGIEQAILRFGKDSLDLNLHKTVSGVSGNFLTAFLSFENIIYYQIQQGKTQSQIYSFQKQMVKDTFQLALWGDSQGGWATFSKLISRMNEHEPAFGLGAGDLVDQGSDRFAYLQFVEALSQSTFVHYPVPGNHDYDGYYDDLNPKNYFEFAALPHQKQYFSWTEGNCAFIALDPDERFPVGIPKGSDQYDWFIEQIHSSAWVSAEWRWIVLHHPPYSQGWPGYHGEVSILELLEPLFESTRIDLVVAGHSHDYERLIRQFGAQKTAFLVVGGGGGGLEPSGLSDWPVMDTVIKKHHYGIATVQGKSLTFRAYDLENQLMDSLTLTHQ
ncbi:metallophosphoesterase [Reichenbachiella sp. MSK19-1]|uniref:metallophosphoesterase family protein n=1 Tax=Reichenbachiella sp. MSK19-1 TaxID=1897631 RepID=UPI000E6C310B|nr:metallophosphoesterase [Reichenbachiella sp. MSK19-1]